jgi:hypothetical protein
VAALAANAVGSPPSAASTATSPLHEFGCERALPIIFVLCPTVLDGDILSVNGANFCQALAKGLQEARFRRLSGTEKPPRESLMASER